MKYALFICTADATTLDPKDLVGIGAAAEAWVKEMDGRGVRVLGNELASVRDATTVRVRQGDVVIADGPFAETKEHIAGFDIIACADLDEAIEVASKHPVARFGTIEVRPLVEE